MALLLLGGALGGVEATAGGWMRTFSNVGPAARWIKGHQLDNIPLIGFWDMQAGSVAIYLQRPIYFLQGGYMGHYAHLDSRRDRFTLTHMPERELAEAFQTLRSDSAILISGLEMPDGTAEALDNAAVIVKTLVSFTGAEKDREIYLYELSRRSSRGAVIPHL